MAKEEEKEKKLIIDEDWKQQAQKEKEILSAQEKAEKEKPKSQRPPIPKGDLAALISMLTTQAFYALGLLNLEGQEEREPDLEMARYHIDMLQTIEEKTKGNLSEQEQKVITETLSQLRMAYVKMAG